MLLNPKIQVLEYQYEVLDGHGRCSPIHIRLFSNREYSNNTGILLNHELHEQVLRLVRPAWFDIIGLTRYDFRPTAEERACLDGTATRFNTLGMPSNIPRVVHFVLGVDKPDAITLILWLAIRAVVMNLGSSCQIRLHYVYISKQGPWWNDNQRLVTLVRHELDFLEDFSHLRPTPREWNPAHKVDVLRLQILRVEEGIYLDTDTIVLRQLDQLLSGRRDVLLGYEEGHRKGMTNAVILAKPGAPFLERWYRKYDHFDSTKWNHHSVFLPAIIARDHPDEICPLPPAAFFWPLWPENHIDWMHKRLSNEESVAVRATIVRTNGSLFDEQLIYHAWNHPSQKYMKNLTPERIRTEDARFNLLVRKYIDVTL